MKVIGTLKAILGLDKTKYDQGLNAVERRTNAFANGLKKLAGFMAAAFSVTAVLGFFKSALQGYDQQAKAEQKLLVALKGREDIQKNLIRQAQSLQRITLFGDEQSIEAAARLAMLLGDNETAIKRLLPLVQDLATAKFEGNLVTAAEMVAKSVGSSTNALSRYGITIEGTVGSAGRLESAIEALNKQVGGQAEAAARVGIGAFTQLKNIISDLKEEVGAKMIEKSWVQDLFDWGRKFVEIYQQPETGFFKGIWQAWFKPNETIAAIHAQEKGVDDLTEGTKVYERTIADLRSEIEDYKSQIEETTISDQTRRNELLKQIQETENLIKKLTTLQRKLIEIEKITIKPPTVSKGTRAVPGIQPFGGTEATDAEIAARQIDEMTEALKEQQAAVSILSSAFDTLFTSTEDHFKNMIESIISGLKRLVAELLARAAVLTLLNVLTGGGASFGTILKTAAASMFPGFNKGASGGTVPPGYPKDTYPALLSSGETILTAGQSRDFAKGLKVAVRGTILNRDINITERRSELEN